MPKFIPLSVPSLKGRELEYVTHAIKTEWVSSGGAYVTEFEEKLAQYVNVKGAVSCQNGTAGLHVALRVSGIEANDMVLVPTLTFIAAVNPVAYVGAEPVFIDCDESLCMDPIKLEHFCKNECDMVDDQLIHRVTKKRVKAIIVVHVFGNMADMIEIMRIATEYKLKVIEDATEAIGTYYTSGVYKGKYAGTIGNVGVYSFNGNKIITTGGGGMIVSNDEAVLSLSKHLTTQAKIDEVYYEHDMIGYNYRMTNIQAGIGIAQLEQLEAFIEIKEKNYLRYKAAIDQIEGLSLFPFREDIRANYWFYSLYCEETFPKSRDEMITELQANQIQTRPIWGLISKQKPYKECFKSTLENAEKYWQHIVNVPCSTNLSNEDIAYVIQCLVNMASH